MNPPTHPLRIGNFSAYYGDRTDTIDELLASDVDVLTGDYLAELTMLVLKKNQLKGGLGYASGFVQQMDDYLPAIAEAGVKVICNAGGLDPLGCAAAIRELVAKHGLDLNVAAITGDDLAPELADLRRSDEAFLNMDTREELTVESDRILTANAYLGAWPIVAALAGGADIVICPRITDASLVVGPAAHHYGWKPTDFDQLAGAMWAGHAIECGGQVTGGNFAFFHQYGDLGIPGMPIAEVYADGTSVITKASNTGGVVTVDTVKAQLLYEVHSPFYRNPDVIGDMRPLSVEKVGLDQVRISGAVGFAPTSALKVSLCFEGGYRNSVTVGITGRHVGEKLAWLRRQVEQVLEGTDDFDSFRWTQIGPHNPESGSVAEATTWVVISARANDRQRVGRRRFADAIMQLGVSSIPGCYFGGPPQREKLAGVQWPCLVEKRHVDPRVYLTPDLVVEAPWPDLTMAGPVLDEGAELAADLTQAAPAEDRDDDLSEVYLGDLFGTRSGDKAGLANLGVWARDDASFAWLASFLTVERLKELVPEIRDLQVDRHQMSRLFGINFVVHAYLEHGVATSTQVDTQAKGLGEYLGSRTIRVPRSLVAPIREVC